MLCSEWNGYHFILYSRIQTASDLPMAMRYRSLQKTYKQHVGVFQSDIHGLGLYCTRDIDPGEMVIEYAGTVIRSVLTDKREKLYDSKVRWWQGGNKLQALSINPVPPPPPPFKGFKA